MIGGLWLVFTLDGRRYGVRAEHVSEVQRMVATVPLPGAPDVVVGVFELRGRSVPIVDVRRRLGLPTRAPRPADHLVIARVGTRTVALRVDEATGLQDFDPDRIDATAGGLPGVHHVAGAAGDEHGLVLLHDLATFLSLDEEQRLETAMSELVGS